MRILVIGKINTKIIKKWEKYFAVKIDVISDYEDILYYATVRYYSLILFMDIEVKFNFKAILNTIAKSINSKATVYVNKSIKNDTKEIYYDNDLEFVFLNNTLYISDIYNIIKKQMPLKIKLKDIKIDAKNYSITILSQSKKISFNNKKDIFYIFLFFARHYGEEGMAIERIINSIAKEPEIISNNRIGAKITKLRKTFMSIVGFNIISSQRSKGYTLSL